MNDVVTTETLGKSKELLKSDWLIYKMQDLFYT